MGLGLDMVGLRSDMAGLGLDIVGEIKRDCIILFCHQQNPNVTNVVIEYNHQSETVKMPPLDNGNINVDSRKTKEHPQVRWMDWRLMG